MIIRKGRRMVGLVSGLIVLMGVLAVVGTRDAPIEAEDATPELREMRMNPVIDLLGPGELLAAG